MHFPAKNCGVIMSKLLKFDYYDNLVQVLNRLFTISAKVKHAEALVASKQHIFAVVVMGKVYMLSL